MGVEGGGDGNENEDKEGKEKKRKTCKKTLLRVVKTAPGRDFFCCGCGLNSGRSEWLSVVANWASPTGMMFPLNGAT